MPDPIRPLRTDHAFVLQLEETHDRPGTYRAGRVEHLASGEATRITSAAELWDFVDKVLSQLARTEDRSQKPSSSDFAYGIRSVPTKEEGNEESA